MRILSILNIVILISLHGCMGERPTEKESYEILKSNRAITDYMRGSFDLSSLLPKLEIQSGHWGLIESVAYSNDRKYMLTGSNDGNTIMWEVASGRQVRHFYAGWRVISVAFSSNSIYVLTIAAPPLTSREDPNIAQFWDAETGQELARFKLQSQIDPTSSDGVYLLTSDSTKSSNIMEKSTGTVIAQFKNQNLTTESEQSHFGIQSYTKPLESIAISKKGNFLITGGWDRALHLWDIAPSGTGREIRRLEGHNKTIYSVAFSDDGSRILSGSGDSTACLWDTETGLLLRPFFGHLKSVKSAVFSPIDDKFILTGSADGTSRLWDISKEQSLMLFDRGLYGWIHSVAFFPDGKRILTASEGHAPFLWDISIGDGDALPGLEGQAGWVHSAALSSDGNFVLTGSEGTTANVEHKRKTVRLWDMASGHQLLFFEGHRGPVFSVAFSPNDNNRYVLTGSDDGTARLWDRVKGTELQSYKGNAGAVNSAIFTQDGRYIVTGNGDGSVRLWNPHTGKEIASLISFQDGNWAVVAPDGRYDSSSPGDLPGLSWVLPEEPLKPYPVEIFMKAYYEPRLLPRLLAGEQFPEIKGLSERNRVQPKVEIIEVKPDGQDADRVSVTVAVASEEREIPRGGKQERLKSGAQDLRLFRDGQLIGYTPEDPGDIGEDKDHRAEVTVKKDKDHPERMLVEFKGIRLPAGKDKVTFSAYAFNVDSVKSETHRYVYHPSHIAPSRKGRAYVIVIGVDHYEKGVRNLRNLEYAVNDAQALKDVFAKRLNALGEYESVEPVLLKDATKAKIQAALARLAGKAFNEPGINGTDIERLQPATPEDLVLVTYSGHGYAEPGSGVFHLFPSDTNKGTVSTDDLARWLRDVDAGEMVMVVDACNSSASVDAPGFKPGPMGSRGFGQLAYDKGMRVLAASQSDKVALESATIKHGLLTYALVCEGIEAFWADQKPKDQIVRAGEWLNYGVERVPKLYQEMQNGRFVSVGGGPQEFGACMLGDPPLGGVKGGSTREFVPDFPADAREAGTGVQQPGLFDFARGRGDFIITKFSQKH